MDEKKTIVFVCAMPPGVNASYANADKGRVKTEKLRAWIKSAIGESIAQGLTKTHFPGQYRIDIQASDRGLARRRDCDGLVKAVADVLVKCSITVDDNWHYMRGVSIDWTSDLPTGQCVVTVSEISPIPYGETKPAKKYPRGKSGGKNAIMKILQKKGINISPEKIHIQ